jgi:uncharacterized protein YutE (UPF0331/DUF86 family)
MVVKKHLIEDLLKQLDTILEELSKYKGRPQEDIAGSLSLRWTVERGLIAAATVTFDVLDHIVSAVFGIYPETYEETIQAAFQKAVLSEPLYQEMKGLGGFRNVLVHEYAKVDLRQLCEGLQRALRVFPMFSREIQSWLDVK